jgi:hypothetical protein
MSKQKDQKDDFFSNVDLEKAKKSAEADFYPKLEIDGLGIENAIIFTILDIPKRVKVPEKKAISKEGLIWVMDVEYNGTQHYIIVEAESIHFQFKVLLMKHELTSMLDLVGKTVKMWKSEQDLDTPKFKGKAKVYSIQLLE